MTAAAGSDGDLDARLDEAALAEALTRHPGWEHTAGALRRSFTFDDFPAAFACMTRVALAAERLNHHPDWSNSWNRLEVSITSHARGGVTGRCLALVAAVDEAAVGAR